LSSAADLAIRYRNAVKTKEESEEMLKTEKDEEMRTLAKLSWKALLNCLKS